MIGIGPVTLSVADLRGLAWLLREAGENCLATNRTRWGAQLLRDAERMQQQAAEADAAR